MELRELADQLRNGTGSADDGVPGNVAAPPCRVANLRRKTPSQIFATPHLAGAAIKRRLARCTEERWPGSSYENLPGLENGILHWALSRTTRDA